MKPPRVPLVLPLSRRRRSASAFEAPPTPLEQQLVPILSVMIASMMPLLPIIATYPIVPPFGFMMLVAWRLLLADLCPAWAAAPLGLFDDLFSGAPIGSGMALWTLTLVIIDFIDTRLVWRDYKQDWAIATALVSAYILLAAMFAGLTGGAIGLIFLVPQMIVAALFFPFATRIVASLDRWRGGR